MENYCWFLRQGFLNFPLGRISPFFSFTFSFSFSAPLAFASPDLLFVLFGLLVFDQNICHGFHVLSGLVCCLCLA